MSKRVKDYLDQLRDNNIDVDHKFFPLSKDENKNIYKLMVLDDIDLMKEPILTKPKEMDIQTRRCLNKRFKSIMWDLGNKAEIIEELEANILRDTDALLKLKNEVKLLIPEAVVFQKRLQED